MSNCATGHRPVYGTSDRHELEGAAVRFDVVLCHHDEVTRIGLHTMFAGRHEVRSVACASDVADLVSKITEFRPHVAVLPVKLVSKWGERLHEAAVRCDTKVLLLLRTSDRLTAVRASRIAVDGFLLENGITEQYLAKALQALRQGEMPMPPSLVRELLADDGLGSHGERLHQLTPREHDTLVLLSDGLSNKQIARRLGISEHGAKRHVANVLAKLNCPNRTLAAALAIRSGLVPRP